MNSAEKQAAAGLAVILLIAVGCAVYWRDAAWVAAAVMTFGWLNQLGITSRQRRRMEAAQDREIRLSRGRLDDTLGWRP